jgi:hypothetical protein
VSELYVEKQARGQKIKAGLKNQLLFFYKLAPQKEREKRYLALSPL